MKFDSNLAWKQASSAIGANREVVLALAGVFFLLPSLAFALFLPPPEAVAGQSEAQVSAALQAYLGSVAPVLIPSALIQTIGTLALLTLLTDRSRPTVGEAIKQGLFGILPYFAAQLLVGFGLGLGAVAVLAIGSLTGIAAIAVLLFVAVLLVVAYIGIKTSLIAPIIAVEGIRNPIAALQRSWRLTRGNSLRIGLFYALLALALFVVMAVVSLIIGLLLAAIGGAETARIGGAILSSTLGAVIALYFVAVLAAVHRQLAGESAEAASAPFV